MAPDLSAERVVPAAPDAVFAHLAPLEAHWALADRWVEVVSLHPPGGGATAATVRLRGPLGVRRLVRTRVIASEPPRALWGEARVGDRTRAEVSWTLSANGGGTTLVRLEASVADCGRLDRLLLAAGGRRWLRARLASALGRLAALCAEAPASSSARCGPRRARA